MWQNNVSISFSEYCLNQGHHISCGYHTTHGRSLQVPDILTDEEFVDIGYIVWYKGYHVAIIRDVYDENIVHITIAKKGNRICSNKFGYIEPTLTFKISKFKPSTLSKCIRYFKRYENKLN